MMQSVIKMIGLAAIASFATTALGQDRAYVEKADLFLDICVASSPTFSKAVSVATDKGFAPIEDGNGALTHDAGVSLSLQSADGRCTCYMETVDLKRGTLMATLLEKLENSDSAPLLPQQEGQYGLILNRDDYEVIVTLMPVDLGAAPWLALGATRMGSCPA